MTHNRTRFNLNRAVSLVLLTGVLSFLFGAAVRTIAPSGFPILWQHVFEFAAVFLGGMLALIILEAYVVRHDVYDDREFALYLGLFTLGLLVLEPIFPWWLIPVDSVPVQLGILGAVEASLSVVATLILERKTELF